MTVNCDMQITHYPTVRDLLLAYDRDVDGVIGNEEVSLASYDFAQGTITVGELMQITGAWQSGLPIDTLCPLSCECTMWSNSVCIDAQTRRQTRICRPAGCGIEVQQVYDQSCEPKPLNLLPLAIGVGMFGMGIGVVLLTR